MKTYYIVPDGQLPTLDAEYGGEHHYIVLGSHGAAGAGFHVLVAMDRAASVPATWQPMPHVLDARTTIASHGKGHERLLADVGVLGTHSMFEAASVLGGIVGLFVP